ncbi:hypothetical protein MmmBen468_0580 [Mycoplasma mycoides subsp. mycoides]|nr:hypothetical protein MmmBen468_0580 [Mycoplasma mycoides subsp. mycoides]
MIVDIFSKSFETYGYRRLKMALKIKRIYCKSQKDFKVN